MPVCVQTVMRLCFFCVRFRRLARFPVGALRTDRPARSPFGPFARTGLPGLRLEPSARTGPPGFRLEPFARTGLSAFRAGSHRKCSEGSKAWPARFPQRTGDAIMTGCIENPGRNSRQTAAHGRPGMVPGGTLSSSDQLRLAEGLGRFSFCRSMMENAAKRDKGKTQKNRA